MRKGRPVQAAPSVRVSTQLCWPRQSTQSSPMLSERRGTPPRLLMQATPCIRAPCHAADASHCHAPRITLQVFDPVAMTVEKKANMTSTRGDFAAVEVAPGFIFVAGGWGLLGFAPWAGLCSFACVWQAWRCAHPIPHCPRSCPCASLCCASHGEAMVHAQKAVPHSFLAPPLTLPHVQAVRPRSARRSCGASWPTRAVSCTTWPTTGGPPRRPCPRPASGLLPACGRESYSGGVRGRRCVGG